MENLETFPLCEFIFFNARRRTSPPRDGLGAGGHIDSNIWNFGNQCMASITTLTCGFGGSGELISGSMREVIVLSQWGCPARQNPHTFVNIMGAKDRFRTKACPECGWRGTENTSEKAAGFWQYGGLWAERQCRAAGKRRKKKENHTVHRLDFVWFVDFGFSIAFLNYNSSLQITFFLGFTWGRPSRFSHGTFWGTSNPD